MVPSGWAWVWAASARTSRPRSPADSLGLAGSAITRKRNRATCSAGSSKPDGRVVGTATSYEGGGRGTGGSQRHPPRPAQGGLVVAPSHPPPLTMVASGQVAGAAAPSRCLTPAASAPSAAKVAHWGTPGGPSTSPPSSTSSAHSPATSTGARTPNRHPKPRGHRAHAHPRHHPLQRRADHPDHVHAPQQQKRRQQRMRHPTPPEPD